MRAHLGVVVDKGNNGGGGEQQQQQQQARIPHDGTRTCFAPVSSTTQRGGIPPVSFRFSRSVHWSSFFQRKPRQRMTSRRKRATGPLLPRALRSGSSLKDVRLRGPHLRRATGWDWYWWKLGLTWTTRDTEPYNSVPVFGSV